MIARLRNVEIPNFILDEIKFMYTKLMKKLKVDNTFIPISNHLLKENQDKPLTMA